MIARTALRSALRQQQATASSSRLFSSSAASWKNVAVLGASGGIGQPVSICDEGDELSMETRIVSEISAARGRSGALSGVQEADEGHRAWGAITILRSIRTACWAGRFEHLTPSPMT